MLARLIALVRPAPTVDSILSPLTKIQNKLAEHADNQVALSFVHTDHATTHQALADMASTEAQKARDHADVMKKLFSVSA